MDDGNDFLPHNLIFLHLPPFLHMRLKSYQRFVFFQILFFQQQRSYYENGLKNIISLSIQMCRIFLT